MSVRDSARAYTHISTLSVRLCVCVFSKSNKFQRTSRNAFTHIIMLFSATSQVIYAMHNNIITGHEYELASRGTLLLFNISYRLGWSSSSSSSSCYETSSGDSV